MEEQKEMVVADPIVMPAVTAEEAKLAWETYQQLKASIIEASDKQVIQGKDYLKKSYWRKIATFFNLSVEFVSEKRERENEHFSWFVMYKAVAKNGRVVCGDGACSSDEKGLEKTEHNTRSIAHTRAFNRAVSNCVGGGEVSAEEIEPEARNITPKPKQDYKQPPSGIRYITSAQEKAIISIYKNKEMEFTDILAGMGCEKIQELTLQQASKVIESAYKK